jgi:hypothetical protein
MLNNMRDTYKSSPKDGYNKKRRPYRASLQYFYEDFGLFGWFENNINHIGLIKHFAGNLLDVFYLVRFEYVFIVNRII